MSTETALRVVAPVEAWDEPEVEVVRAGPEVVVDLAVDLAEEVDALDDYIATLQEHIDYLEGLPHIAPQTNWDTRWAIACIFVGVILMASFNYMLASFLGLPW